MSVRNPAAQPNDPIPICSGVPSASVDQLVGAARVIAHSGSRMSHRELATALRLADEDMVGVVESLFRLGLAEAIGSEIALTEAGKRAASSEIRARRQLLAEPAERLPIVREILDVLLARPGHALTRSKMLDGLGAGACPFEAARIFDHVVGWGRYAGLFYYDRETDQVRLFD